jgi:ABC-2 type transport system permease protein
MTAASLPAGVLRRECVAELKRSWRLPQFLLPTVLTPAAFYALFTLGVARSPSPEAVAASLAGYGVFAATGAALFGFGAGVASEREQGIIEYKRISPMPTTAYLGAKLVTAMAATAMSVLLIYALGIIGGARLSAPQWALIFSLHLVSTITFALIGFGIGMRMSAKGAVAIANALFLGFSVLGGLWIPSRVLPEWMQLAGEFVPSFHLGQLGLSIVGAPVMGDPVTHALTALLMTVIAAWWAWTGWGRSPA